MTHPQSDSSPRDRPQAEHMNVKVATVVGVVITVLTLAATTLLTVGAAWNRLSVVEGRADTAERRGAELDQMRLAVRDLQNQQTTAKDAHDQTRRELADTKRTLGEATSLLLTICLSEERQRRTGTLCKVVQP